MARKRITQVLFVLSLILSLTLASCQGGGFSLFATETPTPTLTFTPTATFTPSPTATATATQTPSPTPLPTGSEVQEQADGSLLFIDYDNKYQLTLPSTWLPIPISKDDLAESLDNVAAENPQFAESVEQFKQLDENVVRLVALNGDPAYFKNGTATNLNITTLPDPLMAVMPLSFVTGAMEEAFKQQNVKVLTEGVNTIGNANGVEVQYIDIEQTVSGITLKQRVLFFQSETHLMMITLTTLTEFSEALFAEAEVMGASIELLK